MTGPRDGPVVVLRPLEPLLVTVVVRLPDGSPLPPDLRATFGTFDKRARTERDAVVLEVDPTAAEFTVTADVPGFVQRYARLPPPADGRAEIRLLHRTGAIVCRLVDESGAAVPDGRIWAGVEGAGGSHCVEPVDGVYRVEAVPAGSATVRAGRDGETALARAEADVRAGEVTDLGTVVLRAPRALAGRVTDAAGRPVGGARVAARSGDFEEEVFSRSDGSFRVVVPLWFAGHVIATKPGYGAAHRPAAESVDLVLGPEGRVRLEVRFPSITTARAFSYWVRDPATGFEWPVGDRERFEGGTIVRGLPPGRVVLVVKTTPQGGEAEVMVVAGATVSAVVQVPE